MRSAARSAMAYTAVMRCEDSSLFFLFVHVSMIVFFCEIPSLTHFGKIEASTTRKPVVPYTLQSETSDQARQKKDGEGFYRSDGETTPPRERGSRADVPTCYARRQGTRDGKFYLK